MKKFLSMMLASLMMATALVGCGNDAPADSAPEGDAPVEQAEGPAKEVKFTTGGVQGTYYGFGTVLAGQVNKMSDSNVTAIEGKGSQGNIELMDMDGAQFGFVQSDVMSYAYEGTNLFPEKIDTFSTVAALYQEQVQIVTCDPSIKTVADLKGKNVSVGTAGSGVFYNAVDVLGAYDLDIEKDIVPQYLGLGESAESLKDGKIDAAFVVAGAPTVAITDLSTSKDTYLVGLDDEHVDALIAKSPYYQKAVIGADVYGMDADTTTVAVTAVVVARDDVSSVDVFNFCASIFENLDDVAAAHAKGKELSVETGASITSVPYHPGAAEFFAMQGIDVPTK